ncbi:MAG: phosphoglycerol geranylgeranyltransferase [Halobacteriaceae archaeon]
MSGEDSSCPWENWNHVLKVDPDKDLPPGDTYEDLCETGTDAIEIGGTLDVNQEKAKAVIDACEKHNVPLYQEPNNPAVVVDSESLDGYLVPIVLNAGDVFWITGAHKEWARTSDIDWTQTTTEAYIVLNEESSAAQLTEANCDLMADDVAAYATIAERMLGQDIVYVEYSGTLGEPQLVKSAHEALNNSTLFYGGGIHDYESAREMASISDVIVVGDIAHRDGANTVRETVKGAKDAQTPPSPTD